MKYLKKSASENPYDESNRQQIINAILQLLNTGVNNLNQISSLYKSNKINKIPMHSLYNILGALQSLDKNIKAIVSENQWLNR